MDELRYQVDLLTAMNQKLTKDERMYHLVCDVQGGAFLYGTQNGNGSELSGISMLGNWSAFFDVAVNAYSDLNLLFDQVDSADEDRIRRIVLDDSIPDGERRISCKLKNKKKYIECQVIPIRDDEGVLKEKIIKFMDITRFRIQNDELSYLAYYDSLTGLYNRNQFVSLLNDWFRKAEAEKEILSVMFVDIDDFKKINDGKGIIVGDELVQVFGQFLNGFSSDHVIVSHFNADTYCIAIYDPCGSRSVEAITRGIKERLSKPFKLTNGLELTFTVSIGVAEYPESGATALELIGNAEIVMFKAKAHGKNCVLYFDSAIIHDFKKNIQMENVLSEAIKYRQFVLYFQPQYYVNSNRLRGVEALIRMKQDGGKIVGPGEFIPIAEQNGSIVEIGDWVIDEALSTFASWREKYKTDMIMSINISAIQYRKPDFVAKLIEKLEKYHVAPQFVELEITETILIDDFALVVEKMHALRDYGIKVSLDDFGTGYSSLSYLKDLPIDTLKIDKSFIDTVTSDDSTRIIMESIVRMVKRLGFETVAEGVETKDQYDYLREIECDNIQGYFLAKPQGAIDIENILIRQL